MAAETLTADQAASTFGVPAGGPKGALLIQYGTYEVAANVEDGDIFEMHYVPPGAVVHSGELRADDLDTGTKFLMATLVGRQTKAIQRTLTGY